MHGRDFQPVGQVAGYVSPGDVRNALRQVHLEVGRTHRALHQHCQQSRPCDIEILDGWGRFRAEWTAFYNKVNGSLWEQMWGSTMDEIERFQLRLHRWTLRLQRGVQAFQPPDVLSLFEGTRQQLLDERNVGQHKSALRFLVGAVGVGAVVGVGWAVARYYRREEEAAAKK